MNNTFVKASKRGNARIRSIKKTFIFIAFFQAVIIGASGLGVAIYTLPSRPPPPPWFAKNYPQEVSHNKRLDLERRYIPMLILFVAFAILILSNILIARWLLLPIRRLSKATKLFGRGVWAHRIEGTRNDEFGELAVAFNEMADRIEKQMKSERDIIATVSHELRTPLTRLRIALELLEDEHPNSIKKLLTMTNDIVEIEQLIDNVFTSARLANHSNEGIVLGSEKQVVVVEEIVKGAIDRFNSRYPDRDIHLEKVCEATISISPMLFRRALENLLENAHKYSDADTEIRVDARQDIDHVLFTVSSIGDAIPEGQRMKVFDPFFQLQKTQGTGLGLTLVKRIAEAHHGKAWVVCESRKNTFVIKVPIAKTGLIESGL